MNARTETTEFRTATTILVAVVLLVVLGAFVGVPQSAADAGSSLETDVASDSSKEYKIKAVFIYRLIRWVTWPESNLPRSSREIVIGVVGKDPFGSHLDKLEKLKPVLGRKIRIKRFKSVKHIKKTQVLFLSASASDAEIGKVASLAQRSGALVIGETASFVDKGGMISLLIKDKRLKFEANTVSAKKAKISISSQILRMATRVVKAK